VATWSGACASGHLLAWVVGPNPAGGMDVSLVSVVCCQVEVSPMG
jgi:hypothetical protein